MTHSEGMAVLVDAAASPQGLLLQTSNPEAVAAALMRIARQSLRPELIALRFKRVAKREGNLVILHGPAEPDSAPGLETL